TAFSSRLSASRSNSPARRNSHVLSEPIERPNANVLKRFAKSFLLLASSNNFLLLKLPPSKADRSTYRGRSVGYEASTVVGKICSNGKTRRQSMRRASAPLRSNGVKAR